LLRREWQLSESPATRRSDEAGLVQMAVPSQPAQASQLGKVYGSPPTEASPPPTDHDPDLGCVTTSHINGRAGWWKSPCPDLVRGWDGQPPSLLYNGLFHHLLPTPCRPLPATGSTPSAPVVAPGPGSAGHLAWDSRRWAAPGAVANAEEGGLRQTR